ncbi:MAG: hypothetical protein IJZ61_01155 [Oscillospiraceae bacterium]|nr:hypothetical protein [Oscillospiraceae bacterium]
MRIKSYIAALAMLLTASALLSACSDVEEHASVSSVFTYIEPAEKFYVPEKTASTAPSTITAVSETETESETEVETTTVTTAETTVTETTTTAETTIETEETVTESVSETLSENLYKADFPANEDYVKISGRTFTQSNGTLILSNSLSSAEFAFCGTSAEITLTSDCSGSDARVGIFVNGKRTIDTMLTEKTTTLKIFESIEPKNCIVSVVKLSEQSHSYVGVKNINVVSEYGVIPTPERERRIEFIGDSITCGYGVDAPNEHYNFSTETEDASKTYAALIGDELDADVNLVAWSGIGAYSCYTSGDEPSQWKLISGIYGKTDVMHTSQNWDFSQWQPDAVVINIGTNDNSWTREIAERVDTFGRAYYDLIVQVREANPNAYIICSLGAMGKDLLPEIKEQVAAYSSDTGDYRITAFEFDMQNGYTDGYGADYHPSAETHRKMADKLAPFIAELMNW